MRKRLGVLTFTLALMASPLIAQEQPTLTYKVEKQEDGSLKVVPSTEPFPEASDVTTDSDLSMMPNDRSQITGRALDKWADVVEQMKMQEFWVASDPRGAVQAVYVLPKGETPPSSIFQSAAEGTFIAKVSGANALSRYLPNTDGMTEILSSLMTNAKNAVCAMPARPKEFGTVVDISAGIGVQGRIEFNATWDTVDLCN